MTVVARQLPHRRRIVLTLAFIGWVLPGHAADGSTAGYSVAPIPDWVAPVSAGSAREDTDSRGGEHHLLVDRQSYDDGNVVAYHYHSVTDITGQAGLSDNSNLSVSFDPGHERLELHTASVIRDGQESDRLQRARVNVARTENEADQALLNGDMTALVVLPDVRVGDRVEFRYTIYGRNPVFDPRHHSTWRVRWSVPIERSVLRVTVPKSMTLTHTPVPDASFVKQTSGNLRTLQWRWSELEPSTAERNTPDWYADPDVLQVTAFRSWQEVANWGAALFRGLPAEGDAYRRLSRSIRQTAEREGLPAGIAMAIDHVQTRIRYYGVELGENSHRPHAPDEVLANGYGDCKDKALLLVSLLGDLGVDANPLLVSTRLRGGIADRLPGPGAFNHVVVLVEHAGERYWVDATDNRQSGLLGHRGQPEYGAGLVLGRSGDPLVKRAATVSDNPTLTTHDRYYLSSTGGPVDLVTSTIFRGADANRFRHRLDQTGKRRLQQLYLEHYRELHGDLESLQPLHIVEDAIHNSITVTEHYRLDDFWGIDRRARIAEYDAYAAVVRNQLDRLPKVKRNRKAPLPIDGPSHVAHRIEFFSHVARPERALEEKEFGFEGFRYRHSEYVLGHSLVFDSDLQISADALPADRIDTYNSFRDRVMRNAQSGRYVRHVERDDMQLGQKTASLLEALRGLER